jgi:hypothetical protein
MVGQVVFPELRRVFSPVVKLSPSVEVVGGALYVNAPLVVAEPRMVIHHVKLRGLALLEKPYAKGDAVLHGGTWEGEIAAGEWLAPGIRL